MQGCPQTIEVVNGKTARLIFFNKTKPGIGITKIDAETKKPLAGAVFRIEKIDGSFVKEYTTDKNGEIKLDKLPQGSYAVTEVKAPDGYVLDPLSQTVTIDKSDAQTLTFYNSPNSGLLS